MKRQHVRHRLESVLGLRDHEAGDEGPQGQRQTEARGGERGAKAEEADAEGKELPISEEHDAIQNPGDDNAATRHQDGHYQQAPGDASPVADRGARLRVRKHWHEQHQRHHAQVLKQEDRDDNPAVRGVQLAAIGVDLQHNGRRGQRHQATIEHRLIDRHTEPCGNRCDGHQRPAHLERTPLQRDPAKLHHSRQ